MLNMMINTNLMLIYDICYYAPSPWLLLIVLRNTHDNLTIIFIADGSARKVAHFGSWPSMAR